MATTQWIVAPPDAGAAALADTLGLHPLTAALLRRRGLVEPEEARRYLDPRLEDLSDPRARTGMDEAVETVAGALRTGRRIAIHGDYDADGISATAILLRGLRAVGADPLWYLPHRFRDGYGLGIPAVETLADRGAQLLVTVDCGITALEAVARARALGIDVVILDHHTPSADRPRAVIVEPAHDAPRMGELPASAPFCAAGLAYMFLLALRRRLGEIPEAPEGLASLAAIGTVADVVPLIGDNRRLVAVGLQEIERSPLPGIRALVDVAGPQGPVRAWHLGWQLAPRLNAPGRLGDPVPALHLLLADSPDESRDLARQLDAANRERQEILERVLAEASAQVDEDPSAAALVIAGDGWHPGVVGLVAGRLAELYTRPAVVVALDGEAGRGSARSVEGFNLIESLGACGDHLLTFGGHTMAAGLSIARAAVPDFRRAFCTLAAATASQRADLAYLHIDAEVALTDLTVPLVAELERLGPFGSYNPQPVFAVRGVRAVNRRLVGEGEHLRMDVTDGTRVVEAIGFAMAASGELLTFTEAPVDLAVVPETDPLDGGRVRLRVHALDVPGVDPETILADTKVLLDRLFSRAGDYLGEATYEGVEDANTLYTKVVGVTFDDRQSVVAGLSPGDRLRLVREPANPYDPHAVRVLTQDGRMLGYLRARLAGRIAPSIDAGARYRVAVLGVTGGGDRSLGVNIFLERDHDDGPAIRAPGPGRGFRAVPSHPGPRALVDRLSTHLNGGRPWEAPHAEALAALAEGRSAVFVLPPGRGWAAALAGAAALTAGDGKYALVVAPLRRQVEHRADQLNARLAPLGLRAIAMHGQQGLRQRERAESALRVGQADVIVASEEILADGRLSPYYDRIAAVLLDGVPASGTECLPPGLAGRPRCLVTDPESDRAVEGFGPDAVVARDRSLRTGLRLVDRRGVRDRDAALEEVLRRDEKIVIYAAGREKCVELAARLRERREAVAYLHGGLPARLRGIITQAFREGRVDILVATSALDEEAFPQDLRQIVIDAAPRDRRQFVQMFGDAGFARTVTATLMFGSADVGARRRWLDGQAPDREFLAAIYRALRQWRGEGPYAWPDEETWTHLAGAVPNLTRAAVGASFAIFEEAGLATREVVDSRSEIQLLSAQERRDLTASLRYREGLREREAFERVARWALQATGVQLLEAVAGMGSGEPAPLQAPMSGQAGVGGRES